MGGEGTQGRAPLGRRLSAAITLSQLADSSPAPFPYPASDYLGFGSHAVHPREGLVENLYLTGDWHLVIGSQLLVTRVLNLSQLRPFLYV